MPYYRSVIVLSVVAGMVIAWTAVLARSEPSPLWLLVVLVCLTASGGPASMIGFDLARTFTPLEASGRANGLVNVGGFVASLLTMALVGIVLELREPGGVDAYGLDDFRAAMSVQYLFWALGVVPGRPLPPPGAGPPAPRAPRRDRADEARRAVRAPGVRRPRGCLASSWGICPARVPGLGNSARGYPSSPMSRGRLSS